MTWRTVVLIALAVLAAMALVELWAVLTNQYQAPWGPAIR